MAHSHRNAVRDRPRAPGAAAALPPRPAATGRQQGAGQPRGWLSGAAQGQGRGRPADVLQVRAVGPHPGRLPPTRRWRCPPTSWRGRGRPEAGQDSVRCSAPPRRSGCASAPLPAASGAEQRRPGAPAAPMAAAMDHMLVPPPVPRGPAVGRRGARPAAQPIGRRGLFDARAGLRHGQVSARLRSVRLGGREVAPVGPPAHRTSGPHPCVRPSPSLPLPCYARLHSLPAGAANCPLRVQRPRCLARTSTWRSRGSSCWVA